MIDLLFIVVFAFVPLIVMCLLRSAGIRLTRFSIPSFVMFFLFVFSYVGILPLYFEWDEYRVFLGVQDRHIIAQMFIFSSWTLLAMSFGMILARGILANHFVDASMSGYRSLSSNEYIVLFVISFICMLVLLIYLTRVPEIALLTTLREGVVEGSLARSRMGNDFEGRYHWYQMFMRTGLFLAVFAMFADRLLGGNASRLRSLVFFGVLLAAIFSAIMSIEKGPVVNLVLGMFVVWVIVRFGGRYPAMAVLLAATVVCGVLIIAYLFLMGTDDVAIAAKAILSRAFTGQITPAYWYLDYFTNHQGFLLGRSFPNPGGILPFDNYPLSVEIMNCYNSEITKMELVGSAPTVYWGEMFANFGVVGVIVPPFFVGMGLYMINYILNKLENTPLKVALMVSLAFHYQRLCSTGLSGYVFDVTLLFVVAVLILVMALANYGRIKLLNTMRS